MTVEEYKAYLAGCDFQQPDQVSKLVTSTVTQTKFNETIAIRQHNNALGAFNYFGGLFGTEVWPDGQGMDQINEYYTPPHIPFSFEYFIRKSAICDPNLADECNPDFCDAPEGGRGTMPPFTFFKWALKTKRDCIANIRHIRQFLQWSKRRLDGYESMDEQLMNMFYTMAGIKTAGNKITMQGVRDDKGNIRLIQSSDPRNPLRGGLYNYMQERFPAPIDMDLMVPLTLKSLDGLARFWSTYPNGKEVTRGSRGEPIYEIWVPDDFYAAEALTNPDYMEKVKILMPNKLFPGTTLAPGDREVIGNFAPRMMPFLPRFAPTTDGRIVPVDTHVGVDIEVGKEWLGSADFENAPFGMAVIVSGKQGTILTRPTLTQSALGFPITPITGKGEWVIHNDYDKECNPMKRSPYATKEYEMGIRMDDPTAATAFLFRRRVFTSATFNPCDFAPLFNVEAPNTGCELVEIGCQGGKRREDSNIVQGPGAQYVSCTSAACGNTLVAPFTYIVKVDRVPNNPGYNSLDCPCGSAVKLHVYDDEGVYARTIDGVFKSDAMSFPDARYYIETTTALTAGECIKGIECADETPDEGNVFDSYDISSGEFEGDVAFILDGTIDCGTGDDVVITYYNAAGASLGTVSGTIEQVDPARFFYVISSTTPGFKQEMYANQASIKVTCD